MKKKIILICIAVLLLSGGLYLTNYLVNTQVVRFELANTVASLTIHATDSKKEVARLDKSGEIRLWNGSYYAIAKGDKIAEKTVTFQIPSSKAITIDPLYSNTYLSTLVADEKSALHNVITTQYPSQVKTYSIQKEALFNKADYGGALLVPRDYDAHNPSGIYRVLLKKTNDEWRIVGTPQIIFTTTNTPSVDRAILVSLNALTP